MWDDGAERAELSYIASKVGELMFALVGVTVVSLCYC